ncbi:MAG: hypothetical protein K2J65_02225 [Duncaniella sp.]|nr:hypothetical protein [Duncaniella sp.]MDE6859211.1 hypothetical protein [Duncaniella sp.]MDE7145595.1 hypothetical protein [Duncaniella sp.]
MKNWIFLILFALGLIVSVWKFFDPEKPDASDMEGLLKEYKALRKRYNLLCAILFFALVLQEIGEIVE